MPYLDRARHGPLHIAEHLGEAKAALLEPVQLLGPLDELDLEDAIDTFIHVQQTGAGKDKRIAL